MTTFSEAEVEQTALDWLATVGWDVAHGRTLPRTRRGQSGTTTVRWYWGFGCGTPWPA